MSLSSLNRPIVEKGCIYNLSLCVCACVCTVDGGLFHNLSPTVTLKMRSRSPKSNQFLSLSQQYSCNTDYAMDPNNCVIKKLWRISEGIT